MAWPATTDWTRRSSRTCKGALSGELFVTLLRKMTWRRAKPTHLVVDDLPAHRTVPVKECVASTNGMLTLHYPPGYAPELNPYECVWSHMKRTGVARSPPAYPVVTHSHYSWGAEPSKDGTGAA